MKIFRYIYNYFLCLRYPFYRIVDVWTQEPLDLSSTWYNDIPKGWRKAFGKDFSKDLKKVLIKTDSLYSFHFQEIKEKYGTLRIYGYPFNEEIEKIFDKYETLSYYTCIKCGKKAEVMSVGWISPYCKKCHRKTFGENAKYIEIGKEEEI